MFSDNILFSLLPSELFPFKLAKVLSFFAFFFKSVVGLSIDFLEILDELLSLRFGVIVDFERALRSQEIWVGVIVVVSGYLLSIKSKTDNLLDDLWRIGIGFTSNGVRIDTKAVRETTMLLQGSCLSRG